MEQAMEYKKLYITESVKYATTSLVKWPQLIL